MDRDLVVRLDGVTHDERVAVEHAILDTLVVQGFGTPLAGGNVRADVVSGGVRWVPSATGRHLDFGVSA